MRSITTSRLDDSPVGLILRDLELLRRRTAGLADAKADERSPGGKRGQLRKEMEHIVLVARAAEKLPKFERVRFVFLMTMMAERSGAHLAVERQELEALEEAHERFGSGSLEVDILVAPDAELPPFGILLDKAMYMSDQRHEGDVGPNGEENRVVDVVRVVRHPAARRRHRQRYELLLEALDGAVDLVYDIPKIPHEADQGGGVRPA